MINGGQIPNIDSGVTSLNLLTGALELINGTNITITPSGDTIRIDASGDLSGITSNVQMQIDALNSGQSFRGGYDASSNLFPSTGGSGAAGSIQLGDQWSITVEGTLGGVDVRIGANIIALADLPGQTASNWNINQSGITSVFGRLGPDIIAVAGDYIVSQVTGAASTAYVDAGLATKEPLITLLPIPKGGTGQATASAAFKALAPSQTTKAGQFLSTDGTNTNWQILTGINGILVDYLGAGQTTIGNYQLATTIGASTTLVDENFVFMSADGQTITLPDISYVAGLNNGNLYAVTIINLNITTTAVIPQGANLLNDVSDPYSLNGAYNSITFIADSGADSWYIKSTGISADYLASLLATKEPLITLLPIAKGGSGQATASAALNAFLPSQTGNANKILKTDATNSSWVNASSFGEVYSNTGNTPNSLVARDGLGELHANTADSATSAGIIGVVPDTTDTLAYPLFANNLGPSVQGARTNTAFNYNAATNTLTVNVAGYATTAALTAGLATKEPLITNLPASKGGTGIVTYAIGDIPYASGTTALSKLAAVAVGSVYASNGVGTPPILTNAPAFAGNPTAPDLTQADFSQKLANTKYVDIGLANTLAAADLQSAYDVGIGYIQTTAQKHFMIVGTAAGFKPPVMSYTNFTSLTNNYNGMQAFDDTNLRPIYNIGSDVAQVYRSGAYLEDITSRIPQKSFTNTGLTATTDILVAVAPLLNSTGYYILTINNGSSNELTILFELTINAYNFTSQPTFLVTKVNDSAGVITAANLSNYLTFFQHYRITAPNPYIAVSVRMTGGLLYSASTLTFTCTQNAESFNSDNPAITQYIAQSLSNLGAPDNSLMINGTTISLSTFPASSVYAYVTNGGGTNISMYRFNSLSGLLTPLSPATIGTGSNPVDIISTPNGKFVYTANALGNTIGLYVAPLLTGQLTTPVTTALAAPGFMAMHPTGRFLYVRSGTSIFVYSITAANGVLVAASNLVAGTVPFHMAITPNGLYLYITDTGTATIRQYSINTTTGFLTLLGTPTIASAGAYGITIHPLGTFAYATNNAGGTVRQFAIASNGQLSGLTPAQQGVGNGPRFMAIHPMGIYAYVINATDNTVSCLSLSTSTGQLAPLSPATIATGTTPAGIRISASGQYLYVANSGTANISAYRIDTSTGALTAIVGSPITGGSGPNQIILV